MPSFPTNTEDNASSLTFNFRRMSLTLTWPHDKHHTSADQELTKVSTSRSAMSHPSSSSSSALAKMRRPHGHKRSNAVDLHCRGNAESDRTWHLEQAARSGLKLHFDCHEMDAGSGPEELDAMANNAAELDSLSVQAFHELSARLQTPRHDHANSPSYGNGRDPQADVKQRNEDVHAMPAPLNIPRQAAQQTQRPAFPRFSSYISSSSSHYSQDAGSDATITPISPTTTFETAVKHTTPYLTPRESPTPSISKGTITLSECAPLLPQKSTKRKGRHNSFLPEIKRQASECLSGRECQSPQSEISVPVISPPTSCREPLTFRSGTYTSLTDIKHQVGSDKLASGAVDERAKLGSAGLVPNADLDSWSEMWDKAFDDQRSYFTACAASSSVSSSPAKHYNKNVECSTSEATSIEGHDCDDSKPATSLWRKQSLEGRKALEYQIPHKCGDGRASIGVAPLASGVVAVDPLKDMSLPQASGGFIHTEVTPSSTPRSNTAGTGAPKQATAQQPHIANEATPISHEHDGWIRTAATAAAESRRPSTVGKWANTFSNRSNKSSSCFSLPYTNNVGNEDGSSESTIVPHPKKEKLQRNRLQKKPRKGKHAHQQQKQQNLRKSSTLQSIATGATTTTSDPSDTSHEQAQPTDQIFTPASNSPVEDNGTVIAAIVQSFYDPLTPSTPCAITAAASTVTGNSMAAEEEEEVERRDTVISAAAGAEGGKRCSLGHKECHRLHRRYSPASRRYHEGVAVKSGRGGDGGEGVQDCRAGGEKRSRWGRRDAYA